MTDETASDRLEAHCTPNPRKETARELRYFAIEPTPEQRRKARAHDLYQHGDMQLIWANEGDLATLTLPSSPLLEEGLVEAGARAIAREYLTGSRVSKAARDEWVENNWRRYADDARTCLSGALATTPAPSPPSIGKIEERGCQHERASEGPRIPLRYGSAATIVCVQCHAWAQARDTPNFQWRPAAELAESFADDEEAQYPLATAALLLPPPMHAPIIPPAPGEIEELRKALERLLRFELMAKWSKDQTDSIGAAVEHARQVLASKPLPPTITRDDLRRLVDHVWQTAHEDQSVPATDWADRMIDHALSGKPLPQTDERLMKP